LIINHLIYYVNKRTLDVTVCGSFVRVSLWHQKESKEYEKDLLYFSSIPGVLSYVQKKLEKKDRMCSKVFRVKLELLFDPVFHEKRVAGVCHWKTVTHKYLLFGLLC